ncbi:MAG: hypothetical protein H3C43_06375 [Leptonema sp. (in: Bacteria)]|nr:hypothetical protein [Leptonema sp. (in: bacteria)]
MIIDNYRRYGLKICDIYFAENELDDYTADIIRYIQLKSNQDTSNFITNTINLNLSVEEIQGQFRETVRNEIRQAENKHSVKTDFYYQPSIDSIVTFCSFYDSFAKNRKLALSNRAKLFRLQEHVIITKCYINSEADLSYHLYLFDETRARLLYSASIRSDDPVLNKIIPKANKLLHNANIIALKEKGFQLYDFGGVSLQNDQVAGIDAFKLGFSKTLEYSKVTMKYGSLLGRIVLALAKKSKK